MTARGRTIEELGTEALDEIEGTDIAVDPRESPEPLGHDQLVADLDHYDAAICMLTDRIEAALVDANPSLLAVANVAVGYDNIDVPAATERGIVVLNTLDVLVDATAFLTLTLMLSDAPRVPEGGEFLRAGSYRTATGGSSKAAEAGRLRSDPGIFGLGMIGRAVVARARGGFGMTVLYHNPNRLPVELELGLGLEFDELLTCSDFLSLPAR
jgi:glyoxylate reductase